MRDRLTVRAYAERLATDDPRLRLIAERLIECVRCCGEFPVCPHVAGETAWPVVMRPTVSEHHDAISEDDRG